jgi:hypothetical protein
VDRGGQKSAAAATPAAAASSQPPDYLPTMPRGEHHRSYSAGDAADALARQQDAPDETVVNLWPTDDEMHAAIQGGTETNGVGSLSRTHSTTHAPTHTPTHRRTPILCETYAHAHSRSHNRGQSRKHCACTVTCECHSHTAEEGSHAYTAHAWSPVNATLSHKHSRPRRALTHTWCTQ